MNNEVTALTNFTYEGMGVRVLGTKYEPWFVAVDVCRILEIKNSRDAVKRLDEDEKGVVLTDTLGGEQEVQIINESGFYTLILRSRKPEAKAFRRWVTHEVLPSIRKYGYYKAPKPPKVPKPVGRPALLGSVMFEKVQKYELANGERCTFEDLRFYCNLLDAPKSCFKGKQALSMVEFINREMELRGIADTKHIYPKGVFCDDVEDEIYSIVVDGKVIELVK